ncbi:FAD-dependent oxidoreductase [uncultured Parasutterella sp.]|uniref:FAD-dependent oxidoreductase n=1 Tax=uncultured Parasutterella sp. TaxID=1263098 RepID=UPI0025981C44|nr:FAD-dependent oxidoreductase [uncultured Parasutterella sp.]
MNRRFFLLGSLLLSYVPTLSAASEKEYSLIIIGSGAAGLSAAAAAAETGLKDILVIEKAPFIGGHSALSGGSVNAVDPEMQLRQGIKDRGAADS